MFHRRSHSLFVVLLLLAAATSLLWPTNLYAQTTTHWIAGSGNWTSTTGWDIDPLFPNNGTPAGSTYNAIIDNANGGAAYTVTLSSSITVNALTIDVANATLMQTGGTFQTTTASISAGTYNLNGGTIQGGTYTISGTGAMTFSSSASNILNGVTFTGGTSGFNLSTAGDYVRLTNGTNFTAVTAISVGNNGALGLAQANFDNANITLNNISSVAVEGNQTVNLGPNVTISQAASTTGYVGRNVDVIGTGILTSQALIQAITTGSIINIEPSGTFANSATLSAANGGIINVDADSTTVTPNCSNTGTLLLGTNGTINLQGTFTTAGLNLSGITRTGTGNAINLVGKVDNSTTGPLALTATTGNLNLNGGTIAGGSISAGGGAALTASFNGSNQLSGVTIGNGALNLSATSSYVLLTNGSTFASGSTLSLGTGSELGLGQSQTVDNVAITLNSSSNVSVEGTVSATLGPNVIISQAASTTGTIGQAIHVGGTGNLTNQGLIEAINTSSTTNINPSGFFTNAGNLTASGGGSIDAFPGGTFNNSGTVKASGGTVTLAPSSTTTIPNFTNTNALIVDTGGTLNLGGASTTTSLGLAGLSRTGTGGNVNLTGTVNNAVGGPLALTATTGTLNLNGGTIAGSSISAAGGAQLTASFNGSNQLNGVTLGVGVLNLSASSSFVLLTNSSTFAAGSTLTLGTGSELGLGVSETVDNVAITLGSASNVSVEGANSATLGPNVTISQAASTTGTIGQAVHVGGTGNLTNQGLIEAINTSSTTNINPSGFFTNAGNLTASGGGSIDAFPGGTFNNSGTVKASGGTVTLAPSSTTTIPNFTNTNALIVDTGGTLNLGGASTTTSLGLAGLSRTGTGGNVNLTGTVNNAVGGPLALTATTGTLNLNGGTIAGSSISAAGGAQLTASFNGSNQLNGVTLGVGVLNLSASSSFVLLTNSSTFAAGSTLTLGTGSELGLGVSETVDNVAITLGSASNVSVEGANSATLGPNVTISQAASTTGTIGQAVHVGGTGNLTNQGLIEAINTSSATNINPSGFFTNASTGSLTASGGGTIAAVPGGAFSNSGTVTASGGTVTLAPTGAAAPNFTNTGTLTVGTGGILNIGGTSTTTSLGLAGLSRTGTGGAVNLTGTLNNAVGGPLALTATTGSFNLNAGTITGGSISAAGGAALTASSNAGNQLSGVSIGAGVLDLSASTSFVLLTNGSTFAAGSTLTIGPSSELGVNQSQTVDNVAIALNSSSFVSVEGTTSAILGPNVTISQAAGTTGNVGPAQRIGGTGNLTTQATIQANASGAVINIDTGGTLTNSGTWIATNGGTISVPNTPTTFTNIASNTLTGGAYMVGAGSTINLGTRTVTTIGPGTSVTLDGSNPTFAAVAGVVTNNGSFSLTGGHNFTVSGGTLTNSGTLTVGNSTGGTFTGSVVDLTGGVVQGAGTITGPVSVNSGGTLHPGNSPGILTVTGAVTLAAGANFAFDLDGNGPGISYGQLSLTGGGTIDLGNANLAPTLGYAPAPGDSYTFISGGNVSGIFNNLPSGTLVPIGTFNGTMYSRYIIYTPNSVTFSPVPEPTFVCLSVTLAAGAIGVVRRRARINRSRPANCDLTGSLLG